MTDHLTEDRKGAVVHACVECAANEGWDLARPLEELETATGTRCETVFADQADLFEGYSKVVMTPCAPTDAGIRLICPHVDWSDLIDTMEMRRKFLAEGID
jgi:hypothetical protein